MLEEYNDILSIPEAMEILQVGKNCLYDKLNAGEIKAFKTGKRNWKIPKESLILYIRTKANLL